MNDKVMIVADLAHFKAFRISKRESGRMIREQNMDSAIKLEALTGFENITPHKKIIERVSDKLGRFSGRGGSQGVLNYHSGEEHNSENEERKRAIMEIVRNISRVLTVNNIESWYFAAPPRINSEIIENVDKKYRDKLKKNITLDLTNVPKKVLVQRFQD